jgi:hypothetical protein
MSNEGIATFWRWWPDARPRIEAAITGKGFEPDLVEEIGTHVAALGGDLDWELAPGGRARHAFCVSAKGDPEGRLLAEIWRRGAPAPDDTWEFHPARQGSGARAGMTLEIDGHEVALGDFVVAFEVDDARERIDAAYFHPAFPDMPENLRATVTFLMVDGAFGEDGVERWLGVIEPVDAAPDGARPIAELDAAVANLAREATGEKFAVLQGEDDGGAPVFVTINQALKRVDHLLACMHVAIDLALLAPDEHGLPGNEEAEQLDAIEDALGDALGATAVYYGRETRRGRRILHWFAPEDGPAAGIIERWCAANSDRSPTATWKRDPRWEVQHRF